MVDPEQNVEKRGVKSSFEDQTQQIRPPQASSLLAWVGVQVGAVVLLHVLLVLAFAEFDVGHHHQRRTGDEDQLERPQADVGDGKDEVIADVGAARLQTEKSQLSGFFSANRKHVAFNFILK